MNCPKCNAILRPGVKFCTSCGQKIETSATCTQCGAPLKSGAKFCIKCGQRVTLAEKTSAPSQETTSDINSVKGRIYWNIQPGQVARIINETEFDSYNNIQGIIIPEGTTAYIRANGRTIASISGGTYNFTGSSSDSSNHLTGSLRKGWEFIVNLFKNKKKEEKPTTETLYLQQQNLILENAKKGAAFSVVILLDKSFPLLFGSKQGTLDAYKDFVPMNIQTRYLDMALGVNAYFKISDPERFIIHYLTERQMLNTTVIVDELTDTIRNILQETLYDTELSSNRIPQELHALLKEKINAIAAEAFFGISIVRIVEISATSEDLERFRVLSRELYLSDKELDYLRRTNDFKNRMADTVNSQRLHEAATDLELDKQLETINHDRLLHEDEVEKFKYFLRNERIVREAQNDDERNAALLEIAKTGFIREDEARALQDQLKTNDYQRGMMFQMMQLRDGIEFERTRMEGEAEKATLIVRKELELQELQDDYADGRFYKEVEKQRTVAETNLDLDQRQRDMDYNDAKRMHDMEREDDDTQFQQFMAIQNAEEQARENQRKHEAEVEQNRLKTAEEMERLKWENAKELSDEKVWALNGGDAAVAYAENKYSSEAEREASERLEAQRREMEARLEAERASRDSEHRENQSQMFQMMRDMMTMTGGIQAQKVDEKERQLRERDERILRQEGRMDTAYDRALDYTTHNNMPLQMPQQAVPAQPEPQAPRPQQTQEPQSPAAKTATPATCPECGAPLEPGTKFCADCGAGIM